MTRIGIRELRQHASRYLDQVKAGEVVEVTERGKLIALLVSPTPLAAERDRLISIGRLTPARAPFQLPVPQRTRRGGPLASVVLSESREDRLE